MARTCCLHAALQASVGRVFPSEINQINLPLQRGRRGPKEPPRPMQRRQSQTLSLQCPPHNAEPRRWSCSNADLPYHLATFLSQTPSYFPQAASPVREGRGEQPPVITAWLILRLFHQTSMLRCSLRSASCQPTVLLHVLQRALILVLFCAVHRHALFSIDFFNLQSMYNHYNLLMSVLFVAWSLPRSSCRWTSFVLA